MKKSIFLVLLAMLMLVCGCSNIGLSNNSKRDIALTIGTKEVDEVEFLYQYTEAISSFYDEYYYYLSYLGVDLTADLSTQYLSNGQSYHDYFAENAIAFLAEQKYLVLEAEKAGFELSEEQRKEVEDSFASFYSQIELSGYTIEEYLAENYSADMTPEDFEYYIMEDAIAFYYYRDYMDKIALDDTALNAYYEANKNAFDSANFCVYYFGYEIPETSSEDTESAEVADESYKDEAKAKAEQAFDAVTSPEDFEAGIKSVLTDDELASFVDGYTEASALYSEIFEELADWLYSEERVAGDKTILEYNSGYFVIMFKSRALDTSNTIDVRHCLLATSTVSDILIEGTEEIDYEATEAAQAAADAEVYAEAEELFNAWVADGAKEEDFIALANEHSDDSATDGLYEMVTRGYMVEAFDAWCFDESREPGDYGIVETPYGYHLMYFVGVNEPVWKSTARNSILEEEYTKMYDSNVEKYPIVKNDDVIASIG